MLSIAKKLYVCLVNCTEREEVAGSIGQGGLGHIDSPGENCDQVDRLPSDRHQVATIIEDGSLCVTSEC